MVIRESLRKMVDWIIGELKEGRSITLDDHENLISQSYFSATGMSGFSIQDLESKN